MLGKGSPPQVRGKHLRTEFPRGADGITPAGAGKTTFGNSFNATGWDHPRRCGENSVITLKLLKWRGSPPQVRGKRTKTMSKRTTYRITPAGAGKTSTAWALKRKLQDHPRRCGENCIHGYNRRRFVGSPPQVRGKLLPLSRHPPRPRITPAGAGKTGGRCSGAKGSWDHPRRCGENYRGFVRGCTAVGSPPQVRGKPDIFVILFLLLGITPAGAGKTALQNML